MAPNPKLGAELVERLLGCDTDTAMALSDRVGHFPATLVNMCAALRQNGLGLSLELRVDGWLASRGEDRPQLFGTEVSHSVEQLISEGLRELDSPSQEILNRLALLARDSLTAEEAQCVGGEPHILRTLVARSLVVQGRDGNYQVRDLVMKKLQASTKETMAQQRERLSAVMEAWLRREMTQRSGRQLGGLLTRQVWLFTLDDLDFTFLFVRASALLYRHSLWGSLGKPNRVSRLRGQAHALEMLLRIVGDGQRPALEEKILPRCDRDEAERLQTMPVSEETHLIRVRRDLSALASAEKMLRSARPIKWFEQDRIRAIHKELQEEGVRMQRLCRQVHRQGRPVTITELTDLLDEPPSSGRCILM
jgi:hypothetical protein